MKSSTPQAWIIAALCVCIATQLVSCASTTLNDRFIMDEPVPPLSVMAWNIWHGGREDGEEVGPQRVIEVIRSSGADVVAMQETYGSGELISEALGFEFHPRGTNVSIHSRYPIVADVSVGGEFNCVGAVIEKLDGMRFVFYSIWLPYGEDIWLPGVRASMSDQELTQAGTPSTEVMEGLLRDMRVRLADDGYGHLPVVIAGDFNSMSHLDYTEAAKGQFGHSIPWTTSLAMRGDGFRDTYRQGKPTVERMRDRTWSPRFPEQEQDRIDFVYDRGIPWRVEGVEVIESCPGGFPSDHAALLIRYADQP